MATQTTLYGHDAANRLLHVGGRPVQHDANGNLTAFGESTFSWNVRDELVGISRPGFTAAFGYDYAGRRTSKTIGSLTTKYLYDGDSIVGEIGATTIHTLHSPFLDEPIARDGKYFSQNHLGSTTALVDSNGKVVERYAYSSFGETLSATGASLTTPSTNPIRFTGREEDGTGLYFYRARYYAPEWGRFISEDPIGFAGNWNGYTYVSNNPASWRDPSGLYDPIIFDRDMVGGGGGGAGSTRWRIPFRLPRLPARASLRPSGGGSSSSASRLTPASRSVGGRAATPKLEHVRNFDEARRMAFERAGMTDPSRVTVTKVDPKTGTAVEFKGRRGNSRSEQLGADLRERVNDGISSSPDACLFRRLLARWQPGSTLLRGLLT